MNAGERTPDAQLNLRACHPDFQRYLDVNETESATARARFACSLDESYGTDLLQSFDVFPAASENSPIFVFIHGGYWRGLDKASYRFTAEIFVANGMTACVLNYRLLPAVKLESVIADIQQALRIIRQRAARYNVDADRIILCGHSAGGHLALIAPLLDAELREAIRGICSISGLFDLEPIRNSYLNHVLRLDADTVAQFSPIDLDLSTITCPVSVAVGLAESELFIQQSGTSLQKISGSKISSSCRCRI